jgi:hypothetical protein
LKFINILFRQYPELTFEVQRTICQGSKAADFRGSEDNLPGQQGRRSLDK